MEERVRNLVEDCLRKLLVMVEEDVKIGVDIATIRMVVQSTFVIIERYIKEATPFISKCESKALYLKIAEMRIMLLEKYNIY